MIYFSNIAHFQSDLSLSSYRLLVYGKEEGNVQNNLMIFTGSSQRMWALQKLRKLMTYSADQIVNVNTLLASPTVEISESELATRSSTAVSVLCYISLLACI